MSVGVPGRKDGVVGSEDEEELARDTVGREVLSWRVLYEDGGQQKGVCGG